MICTLTISKEFQQELYNGNRDYLLYVDVTLKNGAFQAGEATRAGITLLHTQFKALVQGYDFEMDDLGKIKFKNR